MAFPIGCPIKLYAQNLIYIPRLYWEYYGICPDRDRIIREETADAVVFHPYSERSLKPGESVRKVYCASTHIRPEWVRQHDLSPGAQLSVIGTKDGLMVTILNL